MSVFERFTDRARSVVALAQEDARVWGGSIATENILLALMLEGTGLATIVLTSFGITAEGVRLERREFLGEPPDAPTALSAGSPPLTARAKRVFEFSLREALEHGDSDIDTEHILLGVIREGRGVAVDVLVRLGIDLDATRRRLLALMSGDPIEEAATGVAPGSMVRPLANDQLAREEPRCPKCQTYLTTGARFRTMLLLPDSVESTDSEDGTGEPFPTRVVYCRICGTTLQMFSADP